MNKQDNHHSQEASNLLSNGLEAWGMMIKSCIQKKMLDYLDILIRWNRAYNLTAVRSKSDMVTHHLLDSLSVLPFLQGTSVLDVGSGAGLPGIPLALASNHQHFVLLESCQKKIHFLCYIVHLLSLSHVKVVCQRFEKYSNSKKFDNIVCRAFSSFSSFAHQAMPLCHIGGQIIAMKGSNQTTSQEISSFPRAKMHAISVPGLNKKRHIVTLNFEILK